MKSFRTRIAAIAVAAVALIGAPSAALAATYTPVATDGSTVTIPAGGTATVSFSGFAPNEPVTFTLTGENGAAATLLAPVAAVKTAISSTSTSTTASATGTTSVTVTLPANATGSYTLAATGATSGATVSVTIVAAAAGSMLPATGVDSASLMGVWIGGGVLLLGGLAVTVFAVRRQRQNA